jgi:hypothetical protein
MDKNQVMQNIIAHCNDEHGFLIELRVSNVFNMEKYQELVEDISAYVVAIDNDDDINRKVIGCLFTLIESLENVMNHHAQTNHPDKSKVEDAHAKIWHMVTEQLLR